MTGGQVPHPGDINARARPGIPNIEGLHRTTIRHDDGTLYLERYHLNDTTRIHHWHASDDVRAPHDHPWDNTTTVLAGQLLEHTPTETRTLNPGDIVERQAATPHRIELLTADAWTLFVTGPIVRRWGFHTPNGWVHWRNWPHAGTVEGANPEGGSSQQGVTPNRAPDQGVSSGAPTTLPAYSAGNYLLESPESTASAADASWNSATWLEKLRTVPDDATWPRFMSAPHPRAVGSYGAEYADWVRERLGDDLYWWQELVAARILEHDAGGELVWSTWLVSTARQVGKSWQLRGLAAWRIEQGARFGEIQTVMHTGKDIPVCRYVQRPARTWARRHKDQGYDAREGNGREGVIAPDGSEWLVRGQGSVYGYSVSMGLVDEAWDVAPDIVDDGLEPTMVSRVNPQLGLLSTAHRAATSLFPKRRDLAIAQLSHPDDTLILEWSAHPDADLDDRGQWRAASPRWNARRERAVAAALDRARQSGSDDPLEADPLESFKAQWLNIWPQVSSRVTLRDSPLVEQTVWAALADLTVSRPGRLCVAVDDRAGRGGASAAAGLLPDGRVLVWGLLHSSRRAALAWAEMLSPTSLLIGPGLRNDAPAATVVGPTDSSAALAKLRGLITEQQLVHDGGTELSGQVCGLRVAERPGGLSPTTPGASDLVRCAAWAAWHTAATPARRSEWAVL